MTTRHRAVARAATAVAALALTFTGLPAHAAPATAVPAATIVAPAAVTSAGVVYRTKNAVNLRLAASSTQKVVRRLAKGATVTTTGKTSGTWLKVRSGTATGWIQSGHLTKVTTATKPAAKPAPPVITAGVMHRTKVAVNLRLAASSTQRIVRRLAQGEEVVTTGKSSGTWLKVTVGGIPGWVQSGHLTRIGPVATPTPVPKPAPTPTPKPTPTPRPTPTPAPVPIPASFTVTGSGWGHGVGMSQYGARAMAAGGFTAAQILNYYYRPAVVSDSSHRAAENIKVHLTSVTSATLGARTLSGTTGWLRVHAGDTPLTSNTGTVTLSVSGGKVVATLPTGIKKTASRIDVEWPGTTPFPGAPTTVRVPKANGAAGTLELRHGKLTVTVIGGKLNIVNELRMTDEYLYGLAEMPSSWPAAALQSQAIASRSYALRNMSGVKTACDCNVWDEVKSQKFTGWGKENERSGSTHWGSRWTAAVDATISRNAVGTPVRAKSLWYGGVVADATYYSANGGHTRNSQDVWVSAVPYLTARPDPYSLSASAHNPNAAWTATVTQAQLTKAFGVKDIVRVSIEQGTDLTPVSLTAVTATGKTVTITGKAFRAAVPLKAAWLREFVPR